MSLDTTKLKNLRQTPDKMTAQCPACAEAGHDSKGEHLVIYPNGAFGCVTKPGDLSHNKRIFKLVGAPAREEATGPRPIPIRRPACMDRVPKVILILHNLVARPATEKPDGQPAEKERQIESPRPIEAKTDGNPGPKEAGPGLRVESGTNSDHSMMRGFHVLRVRPTLLVAVKDGPNWEERLDKLRRKHTKN